MNTPALLAILGLALAHPVLAEEAKTADNTPKLASGLLMKQGDKLVFAPCRDRSYAIVDDTSPQKGITTALKSLGLDSGAKLYVEIYGVIEGINLKANTLNFARADGRCQPPGTSLEAWQATGNEPGWAMAAGGDTVQVKILGKSDVTVPYTPFKVDGDKVSFEATQGKNKVSLQLERQTCRDAKTNTLFGWTARLTVNDQPLKGCAWQR